MTDTPRDDREVVFWATWATSDDGEVLFHTEIAEAIEDFVENVLDDDPIPETVEVFGYARMPLPSADWIADDALERVIELLDVEHGNPDETTKPNDAMQEAALAFAAIILANYTNWNCEIVKREVVRVSDYYTPQREESR